MMITRKYLVRSAAAVAAASLAVGASLAAGSDNPPSTPSAHVNRQVTNQDAHATAAVVKTTFSAFANPSADNATSTTQQVQLRNALGTNAGADYGAIGNADFAEAKSAPIAGSNERAYLIPSGDQLCIVLPDPGDGYGATCQSVDAINDGKGVLTLTPQPDSGDTTALVAVIVPDGGSGPVLHGAKGSKTLRTSGNVAASVATTKDSLVTPAGELSLEGG